MNTRRIGRSLAALLVLALCGPLPVAAAIRATKLRCEYQVNPLGIDVRQPRLSWVLESRQRSQRQSAYQILIAGSESALRSDRGDLWDSGKVPSDETLHIAYAGKPLSSRQRAWWKVRVWDQDDRTSAWSQPAFWEMGLLQPGDWQAQWIGLEQPWPGQRTWPDARWIWYPEGNPAVFAPTGAITYFRRAFEIPDRGQVTRALLRVTADDYCEVFLNGQAIAQNAGKPYSPKFIQEYDVLPWLARGANLLAAVVTNRDGSAGFLAQLVVESGTQPALTVQTDRSWRAAKSVGPGWTNSGTVEESWPAAMEVAKPGDVPWEAANYPPMLPAPFLRNEISLPRSPRQARLYVTALGVYEFSINGRRVGDDFFNPGWTDYRKRVQYHTYDVTPHLRRGANALGIALGDGWYAGFLGLAGRCHYGTLPLALARLEVEFTDGSRQTVVTDGSWKAAAGPIRQSDMLMGEVYDARREMRRWDHPGLDDSQWQPATVQHVAPNLVAARDAPVRRTQELPAQSVTEPKPGVFVFDLGQNIVGWTRLKVRGQRGNELRLRFGEMTNSDGSVYIENLREARCTDRYILKGGAVETYEPHFTFHGFRYVEVTGFPGRPARDAITGVVLHSDTPRAGHFHCSNPLINRLQSNIEWGQRGNFLSIPTDCPQRDERLGWTGDAQVFIRTATANMAVAAFFTKWCQDVEDAQQPNGAFTDVAPFVAARTGTAAWGDAGVICPWTIYEVYGDRRILQRHYDAGRRWIDYLRSNSTNLLRPPTRYGDWLSINADTPLDLLATAYFAHSTRLMARMAAVLGRTADARAHEDLFQRIKAAFNEAYVAADGRIKGNTQTCYLMALQFDLLPPEKRPLAVRHLVDDIKAKGDHLSTGFVGVGLLMPLLTREGHVDVAYRLLLQDTFPSWLYSVQNGATTIWERWDGWTRENGFQTPWMNSFNHYSLGSVGAWLYETVAGIGLDPASPAFKHIIIRPRPGGGLNSALADYDSIRGPIATQWTTDQNRFRLKVTLPPNTTAAVYLPTGQPESVRERGQPLSAAKRIEFARVEDGASVFQVGSGTYDFTCEMR